MDLPWLFILLALSLPAAMFPTTFYSVIRLGKSRAVYEKISIRTVKKFTQDGDLINRMIRRKFPNYRPQHSPRAMQKQLNNTYFYERFHVAMFLFFLFASLYACFCHLLGWAIMLTVTNVIFNVYPVLLQQYNRLRLKKLRGRYAVE